MLLSYLCPGPASVTAKMCLLTLDQTQWAQLSMFFVVKLPLWKQFVIYFYLIAKLIYIYIYEDISLFLMSGSHQAAFWKTSTECTQVSFAETNCGFSEIPAIAKKPISGFAKCSHPAHYRQIMRRQSRGELPISEVALTFTRFVTPWFRGKSLN